MKILLAVLMMLFAVPAVADQYVSLDVGSSRGEINNVHGDSLYSSLALGKTFAGPYFIEGGLALLGDSSNVEGSSQTVGTAVTNTTTSAESDAYGIFGLVGRSFTLGTHVRLRADVGAYTYRVSTDTETITQQSDTAVPGSSTVNTTSAHSSETDTRATYGIALGIRNGNGHVLSIGARHFDGLDLDVVSITVMGRF